jgi:hypothetical protein
MRAAKVVGWASMVVAIAACGARTQLFLDESDQEPSADGGGTVSTDGSATTDAQIRPLPDATTDAGADADDRASEDVRVPPGDGALMPRIVFFGSAGSYDEDSLQSFLQAYPASVTRLETNAAPVTTDALAAYDIVILDQLARSFDPTEAAALATWVHGGGSVMSLSGFANGDLAWQQPNTLLAALPIQYGSTLYIPEPQCPGPVADFAMHPVTTGLRAVPFCGGYGVMLTGACDGPTLAVAFIEGDSVAAVCDHGSGRVYAWGDDWVEYSATWTPALDTQQFWQDAIDWLAHRD